MEDAALVFGITKDDELFSLLSGLLTTFATISEELRHGNVEEEESSNAFGDRQLTVDLQAEEVLKKWAAGDNSIRAISSEEDPVIREVHKSGSYIVCWDPLDGSSIVDCNWSVGTIAAIWQVGTNGISWKDEETLIGHTGRQQVASAMAVYGPRTTVVMAVNGKSVVLALKEGIFEKLQTPQIREAPCKIFSPANLRACNTLPWYRKLIDSWIKSGMTLRYTGGLVPDVYQLFIKHNGIFCNPASEKAPAKLRLLYELAAIANLVESAGGKTSDGKQSVLDVVISSMDQRLQFFAGSAAAVKLSEEAHQE